MFRKVGVCLILLPVIAAAAPGDGSLAQKHGRAPKGHAARVQTGLDVLEAQKFAPLRGKRIGLITNHTGVDTQERSTVQVLAHASGVQLVALFSPEHGIAGHADDNVPSSKDASTGLPIYSLYGDHNRPTEEMLNGIDVLVFDVQDAGVRFYTYTTTMGYCMEEAAKKGIQFYVLDRPNPIAGDIVEGPVLDADKTAFVAYFPLPVRYGLTIGELARMFNAERDFKADLTVIQIQNWSRDFYFDQTELPWTNPSPNMRSPTEALLYPGVGLLETTNVSVGRGTERPFEWIGAPWIDGRKLAAELNALGLPGVRFVPVSRTPASSTHKGKPCGGVDILATDWSAVRPVTMGLHLATALRKLYPTDWDASRYDRLLVHKATHEAVLAGKQVAEIEAGWRADLGWLVDPNRVRGLEPPAEIRVTVAITV